MFQYSKFDNGAIDDSVTLHTDTLNNSQPTPSIRSKIKAVLSAKPIHFVIIALIILDCIFVFLEMMIDFEIIPIEEGNPIPDVIHGFSIAVLTAFMVEISLKIYVDYKHFFSHKIEILDGIVVLVSFIVDIVLIFNEGDEEFLAFLSLLVLLRLIRIVNGFVVTAKAQADARVHIVKKKNETLMESLQSLEAKVKYQDEEIEKMLELLRQNGIEYELTCTGKDSSSSA